MARSPTGLGKRLPLQEGLFLLGLRGDKGSMVVGWSSYVVGGALVAELLLRGRIEVEQTRWKTRVKVLDAKTPTRDLMLNECLAQVRAYPEMDGRWRRDITDRLRYAILASGGNDSADGDTDERTALLLSLAEGGGLLGPVLDRKENRAAKRRLKALVKDEPVGRAVKRLIQQAAATAAGAT